MEYSEKQLQIMEAAERLFSDKGFDGTSVRDIAEQAGVNLAMISYYFGSKDKLLEALFAYRNDDVRTQLEGMLQNRTLAPMEKFFQLIDYYIDRFQRHQCFHRIMAREQVADVKGAVSRLILKIKKTNHELIQQLVQEGQKAGEFKKNIDTSLMMVTLVGTINHLLSTQHYYREMYGLQSLSDEQLNKHVRKKLSLHLKSLFNVILTHDA